VHGLPALIKAYSVYTPRHYRNALISPMFDKDTSPFFEGKKAYLQNPKKLRFANFFIIFPPKGLRRNNFAELAPGFGSDLAVPIEQNHRNSNTISRILRLRRNQRWPEAGMRKCEVIFAQALSQKMVLGPIQ
jgi:hypothetical protein